MALPDLSQDCIRDTLMYKRDRQQWNLPCGLSRSLYKLSIQRLRSGQLAPHAETKMRSDRYLDMLRLKRSAPEVVISIRDGHIQQVRSTNPYTRIHIADHDAALNDPKVFSETCGAEERGVESDMHTVYFH